jgi:hypothetical protein
MCHVLMIVLTAAAVVSRPVMAAENSVCEGEDCTEAADGGTTSDPRAFAIVSFVFVFFSGVHIAGVPDATLNFQTPIVIKLAGDRGLIKSNKLWF